MDRLNAIVFSVVATIAAGGWAGLAYCARLVLQGKLVPRKTLEDAHDAIKFKDQEILTRLGSVETTVVESARTQHAFIDSLQRVLRARPLDEGDGR